MSKKDMLLSMLKSAGVEKLFYSEGFDFNADHPDGKLFIEGDCNENLLLQIYSLYFDEDCCPIEHQDLVINMALPSDRFYNFYRKYCEEVLHVNV